MKYLKLHLIAILQSPLFISLLAALVILPFIPVTHERYNLHIVNELPLPSGSHVWHIDLDNDSVSERIALFTGTNNVGMIVQNSHGFIEQWNVKGDFSFYHSGTLFIADDYNNDGTKEIYLFSLAGDSILLHTIPDFRSPDFGIQNRLIARAGPGNKRPDPYIIPAEMRDLNGDGSNELIFGITTGFSLYPRNVFAYYINRDSLITSPPSCAPFLTLTQADIDNDGIEEIIPLTFAPSNCDPTQHPLHDHSSWLIILDNQLQFKYEPKEYPGRYSNFTPIFHENNNRPDFFAGYHQTRQPDEPTWLRQFNDQGSTIDSLAFPYGNYRVFSIEEQRRRNSNAKRSRIAVLNSMGAINLYDEKLNHLRTVKLSDYGYPITTLDVDCDGKKEIIVHRSNSGNVIIFREGLKHPANLSLGISTGQFWLRGIAEEKGSSPLLAVVSGDQQYLLKYEKNRMFFMGYMVYPSLYAAMLLFALMIQRIQRRKMQQQQITEKRITGLQLNLIRNQLDPHFTMNVLNSIIYSVKKQDSETASDNLMRFSDLYRNMLMTAGDIMRSLADELAFCSDYLALEKMRFEGKFEYSINVSKEVNQQEMIPKMAVQVFAENAVKHGIAPLEENGIIEIRAAMEEQWLVITIHDNGIGRKKAQQLGSRSTGKGLQLTEDFFDVYKKHYHQEITWQINDLYTPTGSPAGTTVELKISSPS